MIHDLPDYTSLPDYTTFQPEYTTTPDWLNNRTILLIYLILCSVLISVAILRIICNVFLLKKAGYRGWEAIIPFYGTYCHFEAVWGHGMKMFLLLIPVAGTFIGMYDDFKTAYAYDGGAGLGLVCMFFPFIGYPILAFSSRYRYLGAL